MYVRDEPTSSRSASAAKTLILHLGRLASNAPRLARDHGLVPVASPISMVSPDSTPLFMGTSNDSERYMATFVISTQNLHSEEHKSKLLQDCNALFVEAASTRSTTHYKLSHMSFGDDPSTLHQGRRGVQLPENRTREILAIAPARTAEISADLQGCRRPKLNTKDTERRKACHKSSNKGSTLTAGEGKRKKGSRLRACASARCVCNEVWWCPFPTSRQPPFHSGCCWQL